MKISARIACAWMLAVAGSGCGPDRGAGADAAAAPTVTFSNQIVRLMQDHCQSCHRPGGLGPFALMTYEDAKPMAELIEAAVVSRRMPHGTPVRLDTECSEPDSFLGPRRLTQEEIDLVTTWTQEGAPEGDPRDLPPPREFSSGEWILGEPQLEFPNDPEGFTMPGNLGRDVFRRFVIPTDFESDRFITGFEAIPGAAGGSGLSHIVHHVTLFVDPGRHAVDQEIAFQSSNPEVPGPGFEGAFDYPTMLVGMWFPGSAPLELPDGLGVRLPRGGALVIEVHYSNYESSILDQTRVGLLLADAVDRELSVGLVKNEDFVVPADATDFEVEGTRTFEAPVTLYSITPHMHQVGTDFLVTIDRPEQGESCLVDVQWDFEHQGTYWLAEPLELPAGTTIATSCRYDNSAGNPEQFNDPPRDIEFGASADHEMCQLTVAMLAEADDPPAAQPRLVELYYDAPGADAAAEWVKLENPGATPIDLAGYALGWGGADYGYGTLQLAGTLEAGGCAVVGASVEGASGQVADFVPDLQNGGAVADGVALFAGAASSIDAGSVPIDAVLYGGANGSGLVDETGAAGAVDSDGAAAGSSLRRVGDTWTAGEPAPTACP